MRGAELAVAILAACLAWGCAGPERPSIVLVTIDTIRADRLGCYGYTRDTSPHLDAFAADAVLFENVVTPMATTLPAHVSLMTGTSTLRHGIKGNIEHFHQPLDAALGLRTFAQMLADQGYRTAGFVSATPLKQHSGIQLGFEHWDQPPHRERRATVTTDRVLAWLADAAEDGPFFLWVHYFDPHSPYAPPGEYARAFQTDDAIRAYWRERGVGPLPVMVETINNLYDGEIRYLDGEIHRLFEALRAAGRFDDAAVVVTGDHGEGLGQHQWIDHGRIYNEQLFVPLIVRLPGGPRGVRVPDLGQLMDVLPTLAAALDLPLAAEDRAQLEGYDLLADGPGRPFAFAERVHRDRGWEPGLKYALVERDWKYFHLTQGADSLYDLAADRGETRDVIGEHPEVAERMRLQLLDLLAGDRGRDRPNAPDLPPETLEELRKLGYID